MCSHLFGSFSGSRRESQVPIEGGRAPAGDGFGQVAFQNARMLSICRNIEIDSSLRETLTWFCNRHWGTARDPVTAIILYYVSPTLFRLRASNRSWRIILIGYHVNVGNRSVDGDE
jgi:hypothetical protein